MGSVRRLLAVLATAALLAPAGAAASSQLVPVGTFDSPMSVTAPPGDRSRLFVVERAGTVRVVADGARQPGVFLDLTGQVGLDGERGPRPTWRRRGCGCCSSAARRRCGAACDCGSPALRRAG